MGLRPKRKEGGKGIRGSIEKRQQETRINLKGQHTMSLPANNPAGSGINNNTKLIDKNEV